MQPLLKQMLQELKGEKNLPLATDKIVSYVIME